MPPAVGLAGLNGPPSVSRKIAPKLLKLNANDATSSGATETSSSGNVILRKFVQPLAPSIEAASLRSPGIDCSAPVHTRNMYGNPIQRFVSDDGDLGRPRVAEPVDVEAQRPVDEAELGVVEARPHQQRDEPGDRVGQQQDRSVDLLPPHPAVVEHRREEQSEGEGRRDREHRERERPEEDADEVAADPRVGEGPDEVVEADVLAPGLVGEPLALGAGEVLAVTRLHRRVLDARSRCS